ncbi:MAG: RNA polymerase sigma factor [Amaricoccus sp.]|nr:RNA polymerase sigma factor [Amaricoccus sp.]
MNTASRGADQDRCGIISLSVRYVPRTSFPRVSVLDSSFQRDLVALVPRLRRFAYTLCGSADAGDDLVQAACERALRNAAAFQPGTRMDSWMFRIIQNLWLDDRRKRKVRGAQIDPETLAMSDDGLGARQAEDRITLERVRASVEKLPDELRLVVALVAIEGHSYREAAESLDIPIGTVMSRLSRARAMLLPLVKAPDQRSRSWTQ